MEQKTENNPSSNPDLRQEPVVSEGKLILKSLVLEILIA